MKEHFHKIRIWKIGQMMQFCLILNGNLINLFSCFFLQRKVSHYHVFSNVIAQLTEDSCSAIVRTPHKHNFFLHRLIHAHIRCTEFFSGEIGLAPLNIKSNALLSTFFYPLCFHSHNIVIILLLPLSRNIISSFFKN